MPGADDRVQEAEVGGQGEDVAAATEGEGRYLPLLVTRIATRYYSPTLNILDLTLKVLLNLTLNQTLNIQDTRIG